ncbi:Methyltransferase domain-containing protein [Marivirga sericea]|uniref:site-specific DNA-methyltransferase (cytosine-N(4)-specific) n=1 Tax=Marivirga sericea TaxID=1028 RepID=A0A1X7IH94_9BACT|nr:DNA methyltransferase [Marivirga sericea]SMG14205.1 Methyltransferase domain-containing protein [Marivirga sericea]
MGKELVLDGPYANEDFYNFSSTSLLPRHRWYYFKEGFSVGIVKEAIRAQSKNKLKIIDPFNGSGTTALTSALMGHDATGVEVNPFLQFATQIKTTCFQPKRSSFLNTLKQVSHESRGGSYSDLEGFSTFTPSKKLNKWLFNTSVIRRYSGIIKSIEKLPEHQKIKDILRFSAIVATIENSNAKKDGKGLKYKKNWNEKSYNGESLFFSFEAISRMMLDDLISTPLQADEPSIHLSDSRQFLLNKDFSEEEYDLVVTSPPYMNSFDYTDVYRAELFLGGFVKNNVELNLLRHKTVRSHVQVDWNKEISYESELLRPYFEKLEESKEILWSSRIPLMMKAYLDDLNTVLKGLYNRLKKGGEVWLVVSTSAYAGVHIPVDILIGNIGHDLGYSLKGIHCLRYLRTSSQQYNQLGTKKAPLRESLIILKK